MIRGGADFGELSRAALCGGVKDQQRSDEERAGKVKTSRVGKMNNTT